MKQGFTGDVHIDLAALLKTAQDGVGVRSLLPNQAHTETQENVEYLKQIRELVLDILKQAQERYEP